MSLITFLSLHNKLLESESNYEMQESREISALFQLIDDPDEEVFSSVSDRIVSLGRAIIPNLENLWETTPDENVQERIEMLIHKLNLRDLIEEFTTWKNGPCELRQGALLAAKYSYPDLNDIAV